MGKYGQFPGGWVLRVTRTAAKDFYDPRQGFETCGMVEFHAFLRDADQDHGATGLGGSMRKTWRSTPFPGGDDA